MTCHCYYDLKKRMFRCGGCKANVDYCQYFSPPQQQNGRICLHYRNDSKWLEGVCDNAYANDKAKEEGRTVNDE